MLMKSLFNILIIFIFIFSCQNFSDSKTDFIHKLKSMEYTRNNDSNKWKKLFENPDNAAFRTHILESVAKLRNPSLVSFLREIANKNHADSIVNSAVFAIGQTGSTEAEEALLAFPFDKMPELTQKTIIKALAQCCSNKTVSFLNSITSRNSLKSELLFTSAICARKNLSVRYLKKTLFDSVAILKPSKDLAYFLYYASDLSDIGAVIEMLPAAQGLTQKYLIKALLKNYKTNKTAFIHKVQSDSTSLYLLKSTGLEILKGKNSLWQNKFHMLQLSPAIADSQFFPSIQYLTNSHNPHLKLEAINAYSKINPEEARSFLLSLLAEKTDYYFKGELLKILARNYPKTAYLFIMQNLDRGNLYFKESLLDALGVLNTSNAVKTLHQFLNVEEPRLKNKAFQNLVSINRVTNADLKIMYGSELFSSVAMVLNWSNQNKKTVSFEKLLGLFTKFRKPEEFEVQNEVLNALRFIKSKPDSAFLYQLANSAGSRPIAQRLIEKYPNLSMSLDLTKFDKLPSYLSADSLRYSGPNPVYEIVTERGVIRVKLFLDSAPLTSNNFISLAGQDFYSNLTFHRVVGDFVIQGGDPLGDGWGGPDYLIPSEDNSRPFKRGSIGIATAGFDTGSSQFFICHSEQPHLTGNYTLFGHVISGMDVVDIIVRGDKIIEVMAVNE